MRKTLWIVLGLGGVALGLRLYGLDWGLPQVYEEAYPFRKSWSMWAWGEAAFDPNPHYFNYPSLYLYTQLLGQGLLFLILRVTGIVESVLDLRVLYELDKTPFYLMGRTITALFATATVLVTFLVGRHIRGALVGTLAAFLVAVNEFHIRKSQLIEVDVPLTFYVVLCLLLTLRILDDSRARNYVLAGVAAGLAASTKYSAALLPLSILTAHLVVARRAWARGPARLPEPNASATTPSATMSRPPVAAGLLRALGSTRLLAAALACGLAFLATSPFVVLDHEAFWIDFRYEGLHMRAGHFGIDDSSAILHYARDLTGGLLGWPLAITSAAAFGYYLCVRPSAWALVMSAYLVAHMVLISSFSMKAERYLLPLLPIACLLAAAFAADMMARLRVPRVRRRWLAAAMTLILAAPSLAAYAHGMSRFRDDTRTLGRAWIEAQVPSGSFIVSELYGPQVLSAVDLADMDRDVRRRMAQGSDDVKVYAVQHLPMQQVRPESVSPFYDLVLYDDIADYVVISSPVSSRYRAQPELFAEQVRFYAALEQRYDLVRSFGSADGTGPQLSIYRNPVRRECFALRRDVPSPATWPRIDTTLPRVASRHYRRMGTNLEEFGFYSQAADAYVIAASYPGLASGFQRAVATDAARSYLRAGQRRAAIEVVQVALAEAETPGEESYWQGIMRQIVPPLR